METEQTWEEQFDDFGKLISKGKGENPLDLDITKFIKHFIKKTLAEELAKSVTKNY